MVPASTFAVLLAGNFLGAVMKGITGFGSAIILLTVWVVCTTIGIDAGTLQLAVVTDCICASVMAVPLLVITKSHQRCDVGLAAALSLFQALGAPAGAAMLKHLPPRKTEFAAGCLVLLVVLLNTWQAWRKQRAADSQHQQQAAPKTAAAALAQPAHSVVELADAAQPGSDPSNRRQRDQQLLQDSPDSSASCLCVIAEASADARRAKEAHHHAFDSGAADGDEMRQLLCQPDGAHGAGGGAHAVLAGSQQLGGAAAAAATSDSRRQRSSLRTRCAAWLEQQRQAERLASLRRSLVMGAAAGVASGVMAGLTGMGGPPVMLMFERLRTPPQIVRGTNAVCNVLQLRIFVYAAMGVLHREQAALYAAVSLAALTGLACGSLAAAHARPAAFSRMLTALMVLCCVLLFASAAGLAGDSPGAHAG